MIGARSEGLRYTFSRLPWLSLVIGRQYESLLIAVAGLLLPASFLLRSKSRGKRSYFWLLVFALCSVMHDAASYPTAASALLAMGILVAALLLPFFAFDLLAAMVSLSSLAFVNELARLSAVFPSWIPFALGLAGFAAASLAVATYFAIRGESVQEEDVRPLYAKNLAERMGLQAEVRAAREAQLRLMPQSAPRLPGMEFAAVCVPAKGVGGDFFDFFSLDANRVGVFVAQGGERGIGVGALYCVGEGRVDAYVATNAFGGADCGAVRKRNGAIVAGGQWHRYQFYLCGGGWKPAAVELCASGGFAASHDSSEEKVVWRIRINWNGPRTLRADP